MVAGLVGSVDIWVLELGVCLGDELIRLGLEVCEGVGRDIEGGEVGCIVVLGHNELVLLVGLCGWFWQPKC